jgi:hypothetical protein
VSTLLESVLMLEGICIGIAVGLNVDDSVEWEEENPNRPIGIHQIYRWCLPALSTTEPNDEDGNTKAIYIGDGETGRMSVGKVNFAKENSVQALSSINQICRVCTCTHCAPIFSLGLRF